MTRSLAANSLRAPSALTQSNKTNGFLGRALGAGLALTAAFAPLGATAQEATPTGHSEQNGWTDELIEFDQMATAAREYSASCEECVGILLHVGDDFRARVETAAAQHGVTIEVANNCMLGVLGDSYVSEFADKGVQAEVFSRSNLDATATGITYYAADLVYETNQGEAVFDLLTAREEIPRVASFIESAKQPASLKAVIEENLNIPLNPAQP